MTQPSAELVKALKDATATLQQALAIQNASSGGGASLAKTTSNNNLSLQKQFIDIEKTNLDDPLMIGDYVAFTTPEMEESGFLQGDIASFRLGLQETNQRTFRDPLNFEDFVFRIQPMLSYNKQIEFEEIEEISNPNSTDDIETLLVLKMELEKEEKENMDHLGRVDAGMVTGEVKYGDVVQLQHVKSGAFLSVLDSAAPLDPECRGIKLNEKPTSACMFKMMPRFKSQIEGSVVFYAHSLQIESVKQRGFLLHISKMPYSSVPNMYDTKLPTTLQQGRVREANVATERSPATVFALTKFGRVTKDMAAGLRTGTYFRLYHAESESFMQASSDSQKESPLNAVRSKETSSGGGGLYDSIDTQWSMTREGGDACHIPFLKQLLDMGETPDPIDPKNQSTKSVWAFEPLSRTQCKVIGWGGSVRIRHIPSGRYLAVNTEKSVKFNKDQQDYWYRTCLVDDSKRLEDSPDYKPPEKEAMFENGRRKSTSPFASRGEVLGRGNHSQSQYDHVLRTISASSMIFQITPADITDTKLIPANSNVSLRVEHTYIDGFGNSCKLYLRNSEERKPTKKSKQKTAFAHSFRLVFGSARSDQDVLQLMCISDEECQTIKKIAGIKRYFELYSYSVQNPLVSLKAEFMQEIVGLLLQLFSMVIKGSDTYDEDFDWIRKANNMLPAGFSNLFVGEPDWFMQRTCRDMKLTDALFAMAKAPYTRAKALSIAAAAAAPVSSSWSLSASKTAEVPRDENPWSPTYAKEMNLPKGIQKLIFVGLQLSSNKNPESQSYFDRRVHDGLPWMSTIFEQLNDPLGSAVLLSKLLGSNVDMMSKYAEPKLVKAFLQMIRSLGPQPRLINFFEAICAVNGVAVRSNQEMILSLAWLDEENRERTFLETKSFDAKKMACKPSLPEFFGFSAPGSSSPAARTIARFSSKGSRKTRAAALAGPLRTMTNGVPHENMPKDFIGKQDFEKKHGFESVFVRWTGSNLWDEAKDCLFWSHDDLSLVSYSFFADKNLWCRVEDLCWVLEPDKLCKPVTGKEWVKIVAKIEVEGSPEELLMKRRTQLAEYYVGQLNLMNKLCFGRSYNCISWLEKVYSYPLLCAICYNNFLPCKVRSAGINLVKSLYLDRYPQLGFCGKPSLPQQLWVYAVKPNSKVDVENLPVIQSLELSGKHALAEFAIAPSHQFSKHENVFNSFKNGNKFYLLSKLCNDYLESFGTGSLSHSDSQENLLSNQVANLVFALMDFGFESSHEKLKQLLKPLVLMLDGQTDCSTEDKFFEPIEDRYEITSTSPQVTSLKCRFIDILLKVTDIRTNFRLGNLLQKFKEYTQQDTLETDMKRMHVLVVNDKVDQFEGQLTGTLFDDFEALFTKEDGLALDLGTLSGGKDMDAILRDCLMYKDDLLFAKALNLLNRTYGQRRQLIDSVGDITFLDNQDIPVFGDVVTMNAELNYLMFLVRSCEVWGVDSVVSGPFNPQKFEMVRKSCDKLKQFLLYDEGMAHIRSLAEDGGFSDDDDDNDDDDEDSSYRGRSKSMKFSPIIMVEEEHKQQKPNRSHQDILRSMSVQDTLLHAFKMDYNLSFKGSVCSHQAKIESRNIFVEVQSKLIELLTLFVYGNDKNQALVFAHLNSLRQHMGPLKLPSVWPSDFPVAMRKLVPTTPGLNTEELIIECLRHNWAICENDVPRYLLEDFGFLIEKDPHPSESSKLDMFLIMCQPVPQGRANVRNQEMLVDVLLSDSLPRLQKTFSFLFSGDPAKLGDVVNPERLLRMLNSTIIDGNLKCAQQLQAKGYTIFSTIKSLDNFRNLKHLLNNGKDDVNDIDKENAIFSSKHYCVMLEFLSSQLDVLVLDPKIFRMDDTWHILCSGIKHILYTAATAVGTINVEMTQTLTCALRIVKVIIEGGRSLGFRERERMYRDVINQDEDSLYHSAQIIATARMLKHFPRLLAVAGEVARLLSPSKKKPEQIKTALAAAVRRRSSGGGLGFGPGAPMDAEPALTPTSPRGFGAGSIELTSFFSSFGSENATTGAGLEERSPSQMKGVVENFADLDRAEFPDYSPGTMYTIFQESLNHNVLINNKLMARKFELIKVLETTTAVEEEQGGDDLSYEDKLRSFMDNESGTVVIYWEDIVERMVGYMREHNHDNDETTCSLILRIFKFHVLRRRCHEDGSEMDFGELSAKEKVEYANCQSEMVKASVVEVSLFAIASRMPNIGGNLADESLDLLLEVIKGGNKDVQLDVHEYIRHKDQYNKVIAHLFERINQSLLAIRERKEHTSLGFRTMTQDNRNDYLICEKTFCFLQEMCEGHCSVNQNLLRCQPFHSTSINLVHSLMKVFVAQCETTKMLRYMEEAEIKLLVATLNVLSEVIRGPCLANRDQVFGEEAFLPCLSRIIQSNFHSRVRSVLQLKVKACALQLLSTCLEGRDNTEIYNMIATQIEPKVFELFRTQTFQTVSKIKSEYEKIDFDVFKKNKDVKEKAVTSGDVAEVEMYGLNAYSAVKSIRLKLNHIKSFAEKSKIIEQGKKLNKLDKMIGTIEIAWNGVIEVMCFPVPRDAHYLSVKTKEEFLNEIDLSSPEKRMGELLARAPVMLLEMEHIYFLSKLSVFYRVLHQYIVNFKWTMYALVVLLNLNIMMATYGKDSPYGYRSITEGLEGLQRSEYATSLSISFIVAYINLSGYALIMLYSLVTEVPMIIRLFDNQVKQDLENATIEESEYRDFGAFTAWFGILVSNLLFILMHMSNYPNSRAQGLYLTLIFGISLPWTLRCIRNYVVVPNTPQTRIFCLIYDIIFRKPFFRNNALLMICSINGFANSCWYPVMLLDIINNSRLLSNVANSLTNNGSALALVFYLFICTVAVYAQFGLQYFEDWFVYDGESDDSPGCHSVVSCFILIFYNGVPAGSLGDVMDTVSNRYKQTDGQGPDTYLQRVVFDLSFFIWVGILLFNIITGLMVDGFGSLREEDNERSDILNNACFVCGFTRTTYSDIPNFHGPTFDFHTEFDHDFWTYVYFYVYLERKDKRTLSGVERYVWNQISDNNNLQWIPSRMSAAIQEQNVENSLDSDEEDGAISARAIVAITNAVSDGLSTVEKRISQCESEVHEKSST